MAKLDWCVEQRGQSPLRGSAAIVPGACRVAPELPAGELLRVTEQLHNREATELRVENENGPAIRYTLDGQEHRMVIEP